MERNSTRESFYSRKSPRENESVCPCSFTLSVEKDPAHPRRIVCYDPSTAYHLDTIESPTVQDVKTAYEKARKAQEKWAKTSFEERRAVLRSLLDYVLENQETICRVGCRDTGKTSKSILHQQQRRQISLLTVRYSD